MRLSAGFRNTPKVLFSILLIGSLGSAIATADAEASSALLQKGERAAVAGRCQEALSLLEEARAADPGNARAALIVGQCQVRLKRYAAAEKTLEEARKMELALPEVDLYLGMARYHQEDFKGADKALQRALRALPERAEVNLYVGLVALQRGEATLAAQSLARAGSADPSAVEPIASFYQGLALEGDGQRMAAAVALRRAQKYGEGTQWAEHAAAALERLETKRSPQWKGASGRDLEILGERSQSWWVSLMAGGEFDSSVALRGDKVRIGNSTDRSIDDDDFSLVYSVEAGYEAFATEDWTAGIMGTYYATAHESDKQFDTHYPGVTVWLDRRIYPKTIARLQYDFGHALFDDPWIGGANAFLNSHTITPAVYHSWKSYGDSRFFARIVKSDFSFALTEVNDGDPGDSPGDPCPLGAGDFCGPNGVREDDYHDRDSWSLSPGFDHSLPVLDEMLILRGGFRYHYNDADGEDFSFRGPEIQLGGELRLGHQFRIEGFASYTWLNFRNGSTYPDSKTKGIQYALDPDDRKDDLLRLDINVERPINDSTSVSARYTYFNSDSSAKTFDYQRHVVGLYATMRFAP